MMVYYCVFLSHDSQLIDNDIIALSFVRKLELRYCYCVHEHVIKKVSELLLPVLFSVSALISFLRKFKSNKFSFAVGIAFIKGRLVRATSEQDEDFRCCLTATSVMFIPAMLLQQISSMNE